MTRNNNKFNTENNLKLINQCIINKFKNQFIVKNINIFFHEVHKETLQFGAFKQDIVNIILIIMIIFNNK